MNRSLTALAQSMIFAAFGATATALLLGLLRAMAASEQPLLWWASRASGFLAYVAMALSMLFGVLVSSKGVGDLLPRKTLIDLHQDWSLAAIIATVVHVVTIVAHPESGVTPWAAVVPFASRTLTGPVALGTVAVLGMAVISGSSWLRRRMSYTTWRAVHALSFGVMVLAFAHSVLSGTDTSMAPVRWLYIMSAAILVGATVTRVLIAIAPGSPRRQASSRL